MEQELKQQGATMDDNRAEKEDRDLPEEELDNIDQALQGIDLLYRSRCVHPAQGASNVTVREIEKKDS